MVPSSVTVGSWPPSPWCGSSGPVDRRQHPHVGVLDLVAGARCAVTEELVGDADGRRARHSLRGTLEGSVRAVVGNSVRRARDGLDLTRHGVDTGRLLAAFDQ